MRYSNEVIHYNKVPNFRPETPQSDSTSMVTLYLDLDGVIYPFELSDKLSAAVDRSDVERQSEHNTLEWWHGKIVERLGRLPLMIVLSSSWGQEFMTSAARSPLEALHPVRALPGQSMRASSKHTVLIDDIKTNKPPRPFVIVDDDIRPGRISRAIDSATPYMLIKPNPQIGLTHQQLDQIEIFLGDMHRRAEAQ